MFVKQMAHFRAGLMQADMSNYPYVDIAVLDTIRRPFAAGDALVIVSRDLENVVWANGSGLELFGLGRLDAALSGEAALDDIQRRQIIGSVPSSNEERMLHLRFVQGPQTVLLPVHVSIMSLPDAVEAVLLRIPARSLKSRTQTNHMGLMGQCGFEFGTQAVNLALDGIAGYGPLGPPFGNHSPQPDPVMGKQWQG